MAPVPIEQEVRYLPLAVVASHLISVVAFTAIVGRGLFRSYVDLPPAQATRARTGRRVTLIPLFAGLAVTSLAAAIYSTSSHAILSYKVWADQRAVEIPARAYGERGILPLGDNSTQVHVARWLTDTPIYLDAFEIISEKARRFFWGEQIELATISWSLLLSIEGRRRGIPYLWAYLALAHLVSLPFGQNLFYLAVLLTPTPIPTSSRHQTGRPVSAPGRVLDRIFSPKPANWTPHPTLLVLTLTQSFGVIFCLPWVAGNVSFAKALLVGRVLTFAPLVIPAVVPVSWGQVHEHPHSAYRGFTEVFRFISMVTFLLHAKTTALALVSNAPDAHFHRHSKFLPFDTEKRSITERTSSAFSRVLGSMFDHPVVAGAAWDVLLSGVSLTAWAAIRPLDVNEILAVATPFFKSRVLDRHDDAGAGEDGDDDSSDSSEASSGELSTVVTGRRSMPTTRSNKADDQAIADRRRSTRSTRRGASKELPTEDQAYVPEASVDRDVVEGDEEPDEDVDWEAAALTWGLATLGGLGFTSAGVFGAECISR